MLFDFSITDRNNSEVKLYLRSEISASYKEYTEEQVVCKLFLW